MKTGQRGKQRGASILLLSFFFMTVLFLLGASLYRLIPAEMHAASRMHEDTRAHYVAMAGVETTMAWLGQQIDRFDATQDEKEFPDYNTGTIAAPSYPNIEAFKTSLKASPQKFEEGDWTYEVDIIPYQNQLTPQQAYDPRVYSVRSTAFLNGRPIRNVDVLLKQKTFASFALVDLNPGEHAKFLIDGESRIFGPVHTNDHFKFAASNTILDNSTKPYFKGVVSYSKPNSSVDGNDWLDGKPYDTDGAEIGNRYSAVFESGRDGLRNKKEITLPNTTSNAKSEAWPDSTFPSSNGVYIHSEAATGKHGNALPDGGIYIKGDIDRVRMMLDDYGNQQMIFVDDSSQKVYSEKRYDPADPNAYKQVDDKSKPATKVPNGTKNECTKWEIPSGSGGSGISGGTLKAVCVQWKKVPKYKWVYPKKTVAKGPIDPATGEIVQTTSKNQSHDFRTDIIEAVESDVTYVDENGQNQTLKVGQTLLKRSEGPNFSDSSKMTTIATEVFDGMTNGQIYVDGNVGNENNSEEGIWGIVKGTPAEVDPVTGQFREDSNGNIEYQNKTLITPLNKSVNLGGDLLQFDQKKFDAYTSNNLSSFSNAAKVARDPELNELSPNSNHVFGIISRDVWMKGKRGNSDAQRKDWKNNNDGYNDVYAIILAGQVDSNGNVSGGFGTWRQDRDSTGDKLGKFRVFGGVIQGTSGHNHGDNPNDTHYWQTSGIGYEVGLFYDPESIKQRFPQISDFRIMRYLERNARG